MDPPTVDGIPGVDGSTDADGTADVDRTTDLDEPTAPAHADFPPIPALTAERVGNASEMALRGYARRYDRLDATGDPDSIRAALAALVEADETGRLGETVEEAESDDGINPAGPDHRRHAARPQLRRESEGSAPPRSGENEGRSVSTVDSTRTDDTREFEWVDEA